MIGSAAGSTYPVTDARVNDSVFAVLATPPGPGRRLICDALAERNIRVAAVGSLFELRAGSDRLRPHIVVVDAVLAADRADILGLVRTAQAPLIAVSVQQRALREELLLAGADDCMPAPFTPQELIARIVAVVRRAHRDNAPSEPAAPIQVGPLRIDVRARRVHVGDSEVYMTAREFDLLGCFVRYPGESLSRDRLLAEVWGHTIGDASTVTVHVRRLRAKIETDASRPAFIQTVWGVGYRFSTDGDVPVQVGAAVALTPRRSARSPVAPRRGRHPGAPSVTV